MTPLIGSARRAGRAGRVLARHGQLALSGRLVRLPLDQITDEFGFSLSPAGWHPFVAALDDYCRAPTLAVEATTFGRFFLDPLVNRVENLNQLFDLTDQPPRFSRLPSFWLGTYPWGGLDAANLDAPGPAFGWAHDQAEGLDTANLWGHGRTLWYRPDNRFTIENERRLMVELYHSMRRRYSPVKARGFPRVTMLIRPDGDRRAVIVDGHHRLATLAHLGARSVTVEVEATVDLADRERWYYVRRGHCTPAQAAKFFNGFFLLNGKERFDLVARRWDGP